MTPENPSNENEAPREGGDGGERESDRAAHVDRTWDRQRVLPLLLFAFTVAGLFVAFRTILIGPFGLTDPGEFEYWFFVPNRDSGAVSILIAAWFLWNRREALARSQIERVTPIHWVGAVLIVPALAWGIWMSVEDFLIPVLCLTIALLASAWGGRAALRLMIMPCAALMLAFSPPAPLLAEILWRLQNITAAGSNLVLTVAGYAPQFEGTELRLGNHAFVIIEACSGWRGIQVLSIVGLAAAELVGTSFRRTCWVVAAAIPLGIALNVLRACLVMLTQEELKAEFFESHTPQGIAVLLIGAVVLYAFATWLKADQNGGRSEHPGSPDDLASADRESETAARRSSSLRADWLAYAVAVPVVLASVSLLIPAIREPSKPPPRGRTGFPTENKGWTGTKLGLDYFFPYSTAANRQFHAEYRKTDSEGREKLVDLFIGWEIPKPSGLERMPDDKLLLPASDWTILSRQDAKVWQFERDGEKAIVARAERSKFSYVIAWRIRDRGLLGESLLSLLGLPGCGETPHSCPRIVVRIVVPVFRDTETARFVASATANEFIDDFIFPLKLLEVR